MEPLHIDVDLSTFKLQQEMCRLKEGYEVIDYNEVMFTNVHHIKILGRGSYGTVYEAFFRGHKVAVKLVNRNCDLTDLITEAERLHRFQHSNIIRFYALFDGEASGIVMELMEGGSLGQLVHQHKNIVYQLCHVLNWSLQLCNALSYLHSHDFVHRDIKPQNMLLSSDYNILKLCDFGTIVNKNNLTNKEGTFAWMAPEVFEYDYKCDIFSFGISLWEIITRKYPFEDLDETNPFTILWLVAGGLRPPKIDKVPEQLMDLIERCWSGSPDNRPSLEQIEKILRMLIEIFPNATITPFIDNKTGQESTVPVRKAADLVRN